MGLGPEVLGCGAAVAVAFDAEVGEEGDGARVGGFGEIVGFGEVDGEDGGVGHGDLGVLREGGVGGFGVGRVGRGFDVELVWFDLGLRKRKRKRKVTVRQVLWMWMEFLCVGCIVFPNWGQRGKCYVPVTQAFFDTND